LKISDFEDTVDITQWKFIAKGGYNNAYLSDKVYTIEGHTSRWVLKQPIEHDKSSYFEVSEALSHPDRAIRKWQLINPNHPAWRVRHGWIAPYIEHTNKKTKPASDKQIAHKIIKIYQATGNIVADACGLDNFLVSGDEVVCIDVDLALQQDSDASENALLRIVNQPHFDDYLAEYAKDCDRKRTVNVIKVLLYLDREACDFQLNKEHVTADMINKLHGFCKKKACLTADKMDVLWQIIQFDPNKEIASSDITPELIMHLEMHQKQNIKITKESVTQLIHYETTRKEQANISNAFLSLCDMLPTDDKTLLASWDAEASDPPSRFGLFNQSSKKRRLETRDGIDAQNSY
jgi:hypothetical protein